jgi:hypothetical protein
MVMKITEDGIEIKLTYKGVTYNKNFKTKTEMDIWFKKIVKD